MKRKSTTTFTQPSISLLDATFTQIGRQVMDTSKGIVLFLRFLFEVFITLVTPPFRGKETMQQIYQIGVRSMPIILFSISFGAAVTILEMAYHMKLVIGTTALVPGFAALLILRELGSVLVALQLTSRVGAGIAAEVGSMQITEQIDALRLLGIDPVRYLVIPRFVATIFSSMLIVVFANVTCLIFSLMVSMHALGFTTMGYMTAVARFASVQDFLLSLVKAAVFGSVIPIISCFYGFYCKAGAEGVGRATTQAVVSNAVSIIILDFVLTFLFSYLY